MLAGLMCRVPVFDEGTYPSTAAAEEDQHQSQSDQPVDHRAYWLSARGLVSRLKHDGLIIVEGRPLIIPDEAALETVAGQRWRNKKLLDLLKMRSDISHCRYRLPAINLPTYANAILCA